MWIVQFILVLEIEVVYFNVACIKNFVSVASNHPTTVKLHIISTEGTMPLLDELLHGKSPNVNLYTGNVETNEKLRLIVEASEGRTLFVD